jgi:uncharacterized protein
MITLIEQHREQIAELCRRYGVERLDVFGSVTTDKFDETTSDIDLIARFSRMNEPGIARRFVDFADRMEQLLNRPIDLLTDQPFRNPYFAQSVARSRKVVYDRDLTEAAV